MACRKCGSGGASAVTPDMQQELRATGEMALMEYIGTQTQKHRLRSKVKPQAQYVFSGEQRKFLAYRGDINWLRAMTAQFRIAEQPAIAASTATVEIAPLISTAKEIPTVLDDLPIDVLTIDPITLGLLKRKYSTVNEARNAGKAEWMLIKGIGASRAKAIQDALNEIQK